MTSEQIMQELSNVEDRYVLEAKAAVSGGRRGLRPGKIAVIAACLCAVLAGGAFAAAGILELIPVQSYTREDGTVVSYYEEVEQGQIVPVESLSEAALEFAANQMSLPATRVCESWEEAEEFLGLEVVDISAPDGLVPAEIRVQEGSRGETAYHCAVVFYGRCDAPTVVNIRAAYWLGEVWISVEARILTDRSQGSGASMTHYFSGESEARIIGWVTPHGVEAYVVENPESPIYTGSCLLNGISFSFTASDTGDPEETLSALMELIDSLE